MPTAVVSGRVDVKVQQKADAVLRKARLTPTDIIQSVWTAIAESGEVPAVALPAHGAGGKGNALAELNRFLSSLPPANPDYAGMSDDDILALKAADHA